MIMCCTFYTKHLLAENSSWPWVITWSAAFPAVYVYLSNIDIHPNGDRCRWPPKNLAIDIRIWIWKTTAADLLFFPSYYNTHYIIIIYYSRAARVYTCMWNIIICVMVRFVNDGCNDRWHGKKRVYKRLLKKRIGIRK